MVDDVIEQKELATTVLSSLSYKVETAPSGQKASDIEMIIMLTL